MREYLRGAYPVTNQKINAALKETLISSSWKSATAMTTGILKEFDSNDTSTITTTSDILVIPECTITLLERKEAGTSRQIANHNETVQLIEEVFNPTKWNIQRVSFEGESSTFSQYMTIQSTIAQISVTGSGSHMSMFLPDGGVDIELKVHPKIHNNEAICAVVPTITCYDINPINAGGLESKGFVELKHGNVTVDLKELKVALKQAHDQLWPRCSIASNMWH